MDQSKLDLHSVHALSEAENCVDPEPNYILQTRFYGIVSIVVLFSDSNILQYFYCYNILHHLIGLYIFPLSKAFSPF